MFKKKNCKHCGEKIGSRYEFCPYCGNRLAKKTSNPEKEDWGMLGENDFFPEPEFGEIRLPMGLNTLFNSLMKNLDRQFKEMDKQIGREFKTPKTSKHQKSNIKRGGISINISTSGNRPPEIRVQSFGNMPEFRQKEKQIKKQIKEIPSIQLSEDSQKKFSKLPRQEPKTNIRRLSNKVIYEIELPGVKSIKNVSIMRLENSIEIKAISKNKAYFKLISINLPITNYKLSKEKLILELGAGE